MSAWMLYAIAVAGLTAIAAMMIERAVAGGFRGTRWIWLSALLLSAAVPVLVPRFSGGGTQADGLIGPVEVLGDVVQGLAPVTSAPIQIDRILVIGWAASSIVLMTLLITSLAWLQRKRRIWRHRIVLGTPVLISEQTGPAVIGFFVPEVVFPAWALDLDERSLRLLITHEWEHRREGDPLLLLMALGLLVLFPWNLPLWWQVRRLRLAIELDCDARVLQRYREPHAYGMLLLEVGRRAAGTPAAVAAFIHPTSFLERRMRMLGHGRKLRARAAAIAAVCGLLVPIGLYALPIPDLPGLAAERASIGAPDRAGTPSGTPGSTADEIAASPTEEVLTTGMVEEPALAADDTDHEMDSEASNGRGIAVWTRPLPRAESQRRAAPSDTIPSEPMPTQYNQLPELINREDVLGALIGNYPPELKEAGIGGTTVLWVYVDEAGVVQSTRVAQSSGHAVLDEAAAATIRVARFTPAKLNDQPVQVWIQLPLSFQPTRD